MKRAAVVNRPPHRQQRDQSRRHRRAAPPKPHRRPHQKRNQDERERPAREQDGRVLDENVKRDGEEQAEAGEQFHPARRRLQPARAAPHQPQRGHHEHARRVPQPPRQPRLPVTRPRREARETKRGHANRGADQAAHHAAQRQERADIPHALQRIAPAHKPPQQMRARQRREARAQAEHHRGGQLRHQAHRAAVEIPEVRGKRTQPDARPHTPSAQKHRRQRNARRRPHRCDVSARNGQQQAQPRGRKIKRRQRQDFPKPAGVEAGRGVVGGGGGGHG